MDSFCVVHYEGLTGENEQLKILWKDFYDVLVTAKSDRLELGGDNIHEKQSQRIPTSYADNMFYHQKCYKKYTMAISVNRKRKRAENTINTSTPSNASKRSRRSGEVSAILFPEHCMVCKKIVVVKNRKKVYPKKFTLKMPKNGLSKLPKSEKIMKC